MADCARTLVHGLLPALLQVLVSEHNAQPMTVTVTGTGAAGLVRERLLEAAVQAVGLEQQQHGRQHNSTRMCGLSSGPSEPLGCTSVSC